MEWVLSPQETRVLACLVEKEITTPEYYPLTLNALLNACNQKSNRDPVVSYGEGEVEDALDGLRRKGLAAVLTGAHIRVPKHSHRFSEALNLGRRELALLCELMLRGPQTVGELRGHAARMHDFADLDEVASCLGHLSEWPGGPLVARLPRRPGDREARYAHLLGGEAVPEQAPSDAAAEEAPAQGRPSAGARLEAVEAGLAGLREELAALRREFAEFRRQFD